MVRSWDGRIILDVFVSGRKRRVSVAFYIIRALHSLWLRFGLPMSEPGFGTKDRHKLALKGYASLHW